MILDFLLLVVGMMGVVMVLFTKHYYIGGAVSIASFMGYMAIQGTVSLLAFLLLAAGIAFVTLEMLIPGFGMLGIAGAVSIYAGLSIANGNLIDTFLDVSMAMTVTIAVVFVLIKRGAQIQRFKGFVLQPVLDQERGYSTSKSYDTLLHRTGTVVTTLRPSGKVMIDDELYDVVSTGMMIPESRLVQVTKVEGSKITVREIHT